MCVCHLCSRRKTGTTELTKNMKIFPHKLLFFCECVSYHHLFHWCTGCRECREYNFSCFAKKLCVCVRDKKYKIFLIIVVCPFGTYWLIQDWVGRGDIQQSKGKSIDFLTLYSTFFGAHHTDYSNIIACLLEYDTLIYIKYNIIQQTTSHHIMYNIYICTKSSCWFFSVPYGL